MSEDEVYIDEWFIFYSVIYSTITVIFGLAVLYKFMSSELRFGVRSILSLVILFIGEPLCHFLVKGLRGIVVFGLGCLLLYSILPASHFDAKNKAVFITGCDTGIGHALAIYLDSLGMKVFAGCLHINGTGAKKLQQKCSNNLTIIQLDIQDEQQIKNAYHIVISKLGPEGLWSLVNNAGICFLGELDMMPMSVIKKIVQINLLGTITVTKIFLPLLKQSRGRVVSISSLTGCIPFPYFGAYTVAKHGVEAFSDVLRQEMKKWGITVVSIEPPGFQTESTKSQVENLELVWDQMDKESQDTYGKCYVDSLGHYYNLTASSFPNDLSPVLRSIKSALLSRRPRPHYPVCRSSELLVNIFPLLPTWLGDKLLEVVGFMRKNNTLPKALVKNC